MVPLKILNATKPTPTAIQVPICIFSQCTARNRSPTSMKDANSNDRSYENTTWLFVGFTVNEKNINVAAKSNAFAMPPFVKVALLISNITVAIKKAGKNHSGPLNTRLVPNNI